MTEKWIADTGLITVLFSLILGFKYDERFFSAAIVLLVLVILVPKVFYPFAWVWLKLVEILGLIVPKIFFAAVFFVIIFPIGTIRRVLKGDTLLISTWRTAATSFSDRGHMFTKQDIETIY
ncbi:MAG: hypothetical protein U1D31_01180 [Patescibacteria group bacterium]|nr:hypothetical protein [bacterium]MDZ4240728.1 hypothetical protein [Patescibacteria group bacterium]